LKDPLRILRIPVLEQVIVVGDYTNTDHVVMQGYVPEPPLLALCLNDDRSTGIESGFPLGPLEIRPHGRFFQIRVPLPQIH
jgi:hypothetical protein